MNCQGAGNYPEVFRKMTINADLVFQDKVILDVTYFKVTGPNEPIGFMGTGTVSVYSDGTVAILDEDEELGRYRACDLIHLVSRGNSYDPESLIEMKLMTEEESIRLGFLNAESWNKYVKALECSSRTDMNNPEFIQRR